MFANWKRRLASLAVHLSVITNIDSKQTQPHASGHDEEAHPTQNAK
jgi:hypothetical protein